ncbi:MAG TPA: aspartate-semialdehyde dehydrogenase [Candidatus Nitrosotenuis sp.]|nr:aspartate-semialdehyde dehydrogenase [Candidatus Nitrosotenuis sp.]
MSGLRVAVVGATGAVGQTMLRVLQERAFPVAQLRPMATSRSAGSAISWRGRAVPVEDVEQADFTGVDLALLAGGEIASSVYAPRALEQGAVVVDNSATYRMDPEVPLVVPEVNPQALRGHKGLIANPNCSTIQLVVALAPLHRAAGLRRVVVTTFQSVSGTGKEAIEELSGQLRRWAAEAELAPPRVYPRQIAFNLLPQIGSFDDEGYSGEEVKIMAETRRILDLPDLAVAATCVRVPVFYSHAESVYIETERPLSPAQAREILASAPGLQVLDEPARGLYPTPLDAQDQDLVLVGRIRRDPCVAHGLHLWVVADNLRKGAATNAVQIAEHLLEIGLLAPPAAAGG